MKKLILVALAIFATATIADAQTSTLQPDKARVTIKKREPLSGNNSWMMETRVAFSAPDQQLGASIKASRFFNAKHDVGLEGTYLKDRAAINATYSYRFGRANRSKQWMPFVTLGGGLGFTEQWGVTGAAGKVNDTSGGLLVVETSLKFSCFGEISIGLPLTKNKKVNLIAAVRAVYLPVNGNYSNAADVIVRNSQGERIDFVQTDGSKYVGKLPYHMTRNYDIQCSLGLSFRIF